MIALLIRIFVYVRLLKLIYSASYAASVRLVLALNR